MAHAYEVGTRAWQPDAAEGWVASEVVDKQVHGDKVVLVFKLANGEVPALTLTPLRANADHAAYSLKRSRRR